MPAAVLRMTVLWACYSLLIALPIAPTLVTSTSRTSVDQNSSSAARNQNNSSGTRSRMLGMLGLKKFELPEHERATTIAPPTQGKIKHEEPDSPEPSTDEVNNEDRFTERSTMTASTNDRIAEETNSNDEDRRSTVVAPPTQGTIKHEEPDLSGLDFDKFLEPRDTERSTVTASRNDFFFAEETNGNDDDRRSTVVALPTQGTIKHEESDSSSDLGTEPKRRDRSGTIYCKNVAECKKSIIDHVEEDWHEISNDDFDVWDLPNAPAKGPSAKDIAKKALTAGVEAAVSESTVKAFASGDPKAIVSAVSGIVASATAFIPVVGPFVSIAVTLAGSLFSVFFNPPKDYKLDPLLPQPPSLGDIQSAMRYELKHFKTVELQMYLVPTVMEAVESRITQLHQEFLSPPSGNDETGKETAALPEKLQQLLKTFDGEIFNGICGVQTTSPRGILEQMKVDLTRAIQDIPSKYSRARNQDRPYCRGTGDGEDKSGKDHKWTQHWDHDKGYLETNFKAVQDNMEAFKTDSLDSAIEGVRLFESAKMQYLQLFALMHRIFIEYKDVKVCRESGCTGPRRFIEYASETLGKFQTLCGLEGMLDFGKAVRATAQLPDLHTNEPAKFGSLSDLKVAFEVFMQWSKNTPDVHWNHVMSEKWSIPIQEDGVFPSCQSKLDALGDFLGFMDTALTSETEATYDVGHFWYIHSNENNGRALSYVKGAEALPCSASDNCALNWLVIPTCECKGDSCSSHVVNNTHQAPPQSSFRLTKGPWPWLFEYTEGGGYALNTDYETITHLSPGACAISQFTGPNIWDFHWSLDGQGMPGTAWHPHPDGQAFKRSWKLRRFSPYTSVADSSAHAAEFVDGMVWAFD